MAGFNYTTFNCFMAEIMRVRAHLRPGLIFYLKIGNTLGPSEPKTQADRPKRL